MQHRRAFIHSFFEFLEAYPYAFLKYVYEDIDSIPEHSDIDLYLPKSSLESTLLFIQIYPTIEKVVFVRKSFMTIVSIYFQDNSFLSLDLIHQFKRKSQEFLIIKDLSKSSVRKGNIKVLDTAYDFQYTIFFYVLNHAKVPSRYQDLYLNLNLEEQKKIIEMLKNDFNLSVNSLLQFFNETSHFSTKIEAGIRQKNKGFTRIRNLANYLLDSGLMMKRQKGLTITFSGVDGAGKTTILTKVKELIEEKYRQPVKVLRHRPSILPILSAYQYGKEEAEKRTTEKLPRTGGNKSSISSLIRFAYYFIDYIFGQFVVLFKYNYRGVTVIYDRYYFDFINDGKRSNIVLPRGFTKPLYSFLVKPDLNFFLYASPEVILKRKQELRKEDILELNEKYLALFDLYDKRYNNSEYQCINNIEINETMERIEKAYIGRK